MEMLCIFGKLFFFTIIFMTKGDFPFRNTSLSWDDRVSDLVWRLTLEELVDQLAYGGGNVALPAPGIERLDVKPFNWDTECLRGVMSQPSTSFPQSVGLAASFSPDVVVKMAAAVAREARAFYNNGRQTGSYRNMEGINCLAPFINIVRHPLWGRIQEVYGEDPYLSGMMAAAYVLGLHGTHPRYLTASSGCKVVDAYSGPEDKPVSRYSFNAIVSERDMRLTYLANVKMCVKAGATNVMCSYNSINGTPACANRWLLQDIIRDEWGFKAAVVTDVGAVEFMVSQHHFVKSPIEAAVAALKAGVNLDLPGTTSYFLYLVDAVKQGMVTVEELIERAKPLFYTRMRLGEFDPDSMNPYSSIGMDQVLSAEHRELATVTATKTFVLLKNDNNVLPVTTMPGTAAIVGPMSNNLAELYGNYASTVVPQFGYTPYQGIKNYVNKAVLAPGCDNNHCMKYDSTSVISAVNNSSVTFVCLGTGNEIETEGTDRTDLNLPKGQLQLLMDVTKASAGRPVILLLFSAGPVDISMAKMNPAVHAIMQCFFPSMSTGLALGRVLFETKGQVVSPAARMPYTWPANLNQVPPMTNYSMEGRTYRYFKGPGDPLYPFGYGLSYTQFKYSNLTLSTTTLKAGSNLTVMCSVTNTGMYDSDEATQVYISWLDVTVPMPKLQLVGIARTMIPKGKQVQQTFIITGEQLQVWDDVKKFIYQPSRIQVYCGGQQPNQATAAPSNVLTAMFKLVL